MYYPKSQITPNLYTNGGEFVSVSTQSDYSGYYFKISTGKYYTGRNQDDRPNVELIPITPLSQGTDSPPNLSTTVNVLSLDNLNFLPTQYEVNTDRVLNYFALQNLDPYNPPKSFLPYYSSVLPTSQDYQNGEFQRYFCKKTNEIQYIEINLDQFTKLKAQDPQILYQLYQPFTITWILTGNKDQVAKTNKNIVELASFKQKLPRFGDYLKFDYLKYYNQSSITNVLANRNPRTNSISRDASPTGSFYRDNPLSQ